MTYKISVQVELVHDKKIIEEVTSVEVTEENVKRVATSMARQWLKLSSKYPHPEYDIIWRREDSWK